jgi:hypothetical protein
MEGADNNKVKQVFELMPEYHNHRFLSKCDRCGKPVILYTQVDDSPEYYTYIAVACKCGGRAYFALPVN